MPAPLKKKDIMEIIVAALVALALAVYLFYALLRPERF
jgi:K+-transporting ATPase KdpF subunit